ncbi:alpha/beta fold hydrolase [Sphingomonas sp. GCM10030256]|uniref:alpha/beta fold hydrolase n=1 Tax=Sphingomonas sp. GCM10030256 TaxID=3273427 RepID=UPI00361FB6E5
MNHIEYDWNSPIWRHWLRELVHGHQLIRYDERANGLSDWDSADISFEAFVDDLENVADAAGAERFDLLGISQGAAVAIAYAVRHPDRVRKLLIWGGYAAGWKARGSPEEVARREAMLTLTEVGWGSDNPAYRHMFTGLYIPGGSQEQASWFDELQRVSTSPANAVRLQRALSLIDVRHLLGQVKVPTLIMHARGDQVVPFSCGEDLARGIPGAKFLPLDGRNHILLEDEPAWPAFVRAARQFLGDGTALVAEPPRAEERTGQFRSADGTLVGYAATGYGWPIAMPAVWYHDVASDCASPVWRHWLTEAMTDRQLIRTDLRGWGLSGPRHGDWSLEGLIDDFTCVLDGLGVEQCDLIAFAHGSLVALAVAARQPERVRKLVVVGGYAQGFGVRGDPQEIGRRESLTALARNFKGREDATFAQMLGAMYWPGARGETVDWLRGRLQAINSLDEGLQEVLRTADLMPELGRIAADTLFLHSKGDRIINLACAREAAAAIRAARLVELDSENHLLIASEPAWDVARRELRSFLSRGAALPAGQGRQAATIN